MRDSTIASERSTIFDFLRFLGEPVWTAQPADADRYLSWLRRERPLQGSTVHGKAVALAEFYSFLLTRYQGDVHALTGFVLVQPIDEFNRPAKCDTGAGRVPPSTAEVERLFAGWRESLPHRRGRGPKTRLVPCIDGVEPLLRWWVADVRHQFGDDYADPDAPLLPSERRDPHDGHCLRAGGDALRTGLAAAVGLWLPAWQGRLTPHGLRHYCASSLYERGMDLKAIQELLGHSWLSTTTRYIHVPSEHIEHAWMTANARVATRLETEE